MRPAATPTATAPKPTLTPTMRPTPTSIPPPSPTPTDEARIKTQGTVLASATGSGAFAIASLAGITLEAGRSYVLRVSSPAGRVEFFGSYSASAMGAGGRPGVQVELLDGVTPATYAITPPTEDPTNWLYAVSVQNSGDGGIQVAVVDTTVE